MTRTTVALMAALLVQAACAGNDAPSSSSSAAGSPTPVSTAAESAAAGGRRVIRPSGFPDRPYSYGVRVGDTVFLSGQLGRHPETGAQPDGIEAQTRQAMENIGAILKADGLGFEHLVKCHVYLASMDDYAGMNKVYGSFFTERVPARTTVEADAVPAGAAVEIACVAHADLAGISVVRPPDGSLPAPLGPYSAAVWAGDTLYLSGMGGQNPADRQVAERVPAQVTQTLANIGTTLTAAGLGFADVVSSTAYITAPSEMDGFEPAFAAPFGTGTVPPVSVIHLPRLPGPIKAELTFVAARQRGTGLYAQVVSAPEAGPGVDAQARAVMTTLQEAVRAQGLAWADVAHVQVYLADLADMPAMDAVYRDLFPQDAPARTTIQAQLPGAARVQVSLTAVRLRPLRGATADR
jgi:2-iminobutanoate/2-iminopropanoate deaminase